VAVERSHLVVLYTLPEGNIVVTTYQGYWGLTVA
jgi:hypothetical protein